MQQSDPSDSAHVPSARASITRSQFIRLPLAKQKAVVEHMRQTTAAEAEEAAPAEGSATAHPTIDADGQIVMFTAQDGSLLHVKVPEGCLSSDISSDEDDDDGFTHAEGVISSNDEEAMTVVDGVDSDGLTHAEGAYTEADFTDSDSSI